MHDQTTDDHPLDPAAGLEIIAAQRARFRDDAQVDGRVLFVIWGVAWLVGYGALWLGTRSQVVYDPPANAFWVFAACIGGAVVLTLVHVLRRTSGMQGPHVRAGAMFGWSWFLGFAVMSLLIGSIVRSGASPVVVALVSNTVACLIVGLLYMASGAFQHQPWLFWLGAWILVVAATASRVGLPATYLVMALAGGGGLLVGAAIEHVRRRLSAGEVP